MPLRLPSAPSRVLAQCEHHHRLFPLTLRRTFTPPPSPLFKKKRPAKSRRDLAHTLDAYVSAPTLPPPYPYEATQKLYKQSETGLYGGLRIRFGNNVSKRNEIKTRRTWKPNIVHKKLYSVALARQLKLRVATRVMRTIDKVGGLDEYLLGGKPQRLKELGPEGWRLRWAVLQALRDSERVRRDPRLVAELQSGVPRQEGQEGVVDDVAVPSVATTVDVPEVQPRATVLAAEDGKLKEKELKEQKVKELEEREQAFKREQEEFKEGIRELKKELRQINKEIRLVKERLKQSLGELADFEEELLAMENPPPSVIEKLYDEACLVVDRAAQVGESSLVRVREVKRRNAELAKVERRLNEELLRRGERPMWEEPPSSTMLQRMGQAISRPFVELSRWLSGRR